MGNTMHIAIRDGELAALWTHRDARLHSGQRADLQADKGLSTSRATQAKGNPEPLAKYEVPRLGVLRTRLQVAQRRRLARFVGRPAELEQLHQALDEAKAGVGQVVAIG